MASASSPSKPPVAPERSGKAGKFVAEHGSLRLVRRGDGEAVDLRGKRGTVVADELADAADPAART